MSDLVERLGQYASDWRERAASKDIIDEAIIEIEALRKAALRDGPTAADEREWLRLRVASARGSIRGDGLYERGQKEMALQILDAIDDAPPTSKRSVALVELHRIFGAYDRMEAGVSELAHAVRVFLHMDDSL